MNSCRHLALRLWLIGLLLSLVIGGPGGVFAQAAPGPHKPIIPLQPGNLFPYLPSTPVGWELKESKAKNYFLGWICSQASREFNRPVKSGPGSPQSPPMITRIRVMDTGYYGSFNGDFDNFRVGKYPGAESLLIAGMPARKITLATTKERLRVSVRGRFIVEVETENQPANTGEAWIKLFDFRKLATIPDSGSTQLPKPIVIQSLDELNPKNNSSSQLYWSGAPSTE